MVVSVEKKEISKREGREWHNGTENVKWNDKQDNYWLIVWHMNTSWKCAGKCARLPNNSCYHYNTFAQHFFYTRSESDKSNLSQFCTLCIASELRRVDSMLPSGKSSTNRCILMLMLILTVQIALVLYSSHTLPPTNKHKINIYKSCVPIHQYNRNLVGKMFRNILIIE